MPETKHFGGILKGRGLSEKPSEDGPKMLEWQMQTGKEVLPRAHELQAGLRGSHGDVKKHFLYPEVLEAVSRGLDWTAGAREDLEGRDRSQSVFR